MPGGKTGPYQPPSQSHEPNATCVPQVMGKSHYYLVDPSGITAGTAVSTLDFRTIETSTPFVVGGLRVSH